MTNPSDRLLETPGICRTIGRSSGGSSDLRLPDAAPIQHNARHVTASRAVSTIEVSQKLKEPHHVARRALLTDGYQELEG